MLIYKTHDDYIGTDEEHYAKWLCDKAIHNGECWECHLAPNQKGYSNVAVGERKDRKWRAHRLIYTVIHGEIPMFSNVLHTCDNRRCIRPKHLFLGSEADNTVDMMAKGRGKYILPDNRKVFHAMGDIIQRRNNGETYKQIAEHYGVSPTTIMNNLMRCQDV